MKKVAVLLSIAAMGSAFAQTVIYSPSRSIADQSISLKSWGSGSISETDEVAYEGTKSIRVSSRNYFQGGRITMGKSSALSSLYEDKDNLLMLAFRIANSSVRIGGGGAGGRPGSEGGPGGLAGGDGGGREGGGGVGFGAPGGGKSGGGGGAAASTTAAPALKNIRLVITTTDGMKSEVYMAIPAGADSGWRQIGIPLQAITGFGKTNKDVKDVTFSGDSLATFYVGEIRVANDSTPITGSLDRSDMNLALGDEVEFNGSAFGGASQLVYNWDFDESDGLQVEATGATIKRRFRKPGKYVVTMTVVDVYGLKKPLVKKATITVNP